MAIVFTKAGYEEIRQLVKRTEKALREASRSKNEAASGQDGWHDEGYKIGVGEEMTWSKRLGELQEMLFGAEIIEPEEQDNCVQIGNGVVIQYSDGSTFEFILEGYWVGSLENRVSVYSPIGQVLLGAKKGEKRALKSDKEGAVTVINILSPSSAPKT